MSLGRPTLALAPLPRDHHAYDGGRALPAGCNEGLREVVGNDSLQLVGRSKFIRYVLHRVCRATCTAITYNRTLGSRLVRFALSTFPLQSAAGQGTPSEAPSIEAPMEHVTDGINDPPLPL